MAVVFINKDSDFSVTNPKLCSIFATVGCLAFGGEQCQSTLLSLTGIYLARCLPVFQNLPKVGMDLNQAYFIRVNSFS